MAREVSPSEEVRRMLDERGIEYTICMPWNDTAWEHGGTHFTATERFGKIYLQTSQESLTPEQAIAATVGADLNTREAIRKLLDKLNTELCNAGCVVKCKTRDERQGLIDAVKDKYAQAIAATVSNRSCASCPEMDNPDSYISHLQSALKWHDEHVPRPTNPRNTCVVLKGERPPEEVLFVREEGEVTHYLPEGTCENEWAEFGKFKCSKCGLQVDSMSTNTTAPMPIRYCPNCGRRLEVGE